MWAHFKEWPSDMSKHVYGQVYPHLHFNSCISLTSLTTKRHTPENRIAGEHKQMNASFILLIQGRRHAIVPNHHRLKQRATATRRYN